MLTRLFTPGSTTTATSVGLLVLRLGLGMMMLTFHGWVKVVNFGDLSARFADPYGLGRPLSLSLSIVAELICAALVAAGLTTRLAALVLVVNMSTAFVFAHNMKLSGPGNGELALIYLVGWLTILLAGPGRFSMDQSLFRRRGR
jgi:putative oxidoreductase